MLNKDSFKHLNVCHSRKRSVSGIFLKERFRTDPRRGEDKSRNDSKKRISIAWSVVYVIEFMNRCTKTSISKATLMSFPRKLSGQ
jgi:hypothetical protein